MKFFAKKGFTLAELIISVAIGSTVLVFVFSFVTDAIEGLAETNEQTKVLNQFYEYVTKIDNFKNTYTTGSLVYDMPANTGFDILMLNNHGETSGVLLGVVDQQNLKLVPNAEYTVYTDKVLGYRELTAANITAINATPSTVYDLQFYEDKIYRELIVKDFQTEFYNDGTILDMDIALVLKFRAGLNGSPWNNVPYAADEDLFRVDLNF